ncbi:MAG: gamma-glutamyl-phosphate reductase, partial [candidate division Zixibacteria bacterium]|nr:gamma-glutamyl-phosphate reductase [candidate division Zixibacteria bacterium]NIR67112.1 gamma-glutamyl-phosphate reductase [candidate division Zixibacteria bacterium]NIS48534.1 gamma-glutamyl-phosphate reductase [candidate division Zixibacteria bacterium]NIU16622.1 gamma-glutamyl-phosphate reductase [candidate division Zixibacteria bacterium]NIV08774.1 gamma-glutamyl-phosphate reductase [candidate division Zixibacteria bacterium]
MDIQNYVKEQALEAKKGAREIGRANSGRKNAALLLMAKGIREHSATLKEEN